jgi:hypothetical protein
MGRVIQRIGSPKVDTGNRLSFKVRALDLKINGSEVRSPIRVVNQQEMSSKANLPSEIAVETPIGIMDVRVSNDRLSNFLTNNGYVSRLIGKLQTNYPMFIHFPFKGILIQPTDEANTTLSNNSKLRNNFYRLTWQITQFTEFNAYILPFIQSPLSELKKMIKKFLENNFESNKEIIVSIDPSYKKINELLRFIDNELVQTKTINSVSILNRSLKSNLISYNNIWDTFYERRIMMLGVGLDRALADFYNLSGPHLESFFVGDAFSLRTFKAFSSEEKPVEAMTKFFLKKNLTVSKFSEILTSYKNFDNFVDEIISDFDKTGQKDKEYIKKSLNNWQSINDETDKGKRVKKIRIFSSLSKVHEIISSNKEFSVVQDYIRKNEAEDYIKQQSVLKKVISSTKLFPFFKK